MKNGIDALSMRKSYSVVIIHEIHSTYGMCESIDLHFMCELQIENRKMPNTNLPSRVMPRAMDSIVLR